MQPDMPNLVKCRSCKGFFWLSELEPLPRGADPWGPGGPTPEQSVHVSGYPTLEELYEILAIVEVQDKESRADIRIRILQTYNDRVRKGKPLFETEGDEQRFTANARALLDLLDPTEAHAGLLSAEICRNLGEFDRCMKILVSIRDPRMIRPISQMLEKANLGDREVFRFQ